MPVISEKAFAWASSQVEAGRKVYWICPDRTHVEDVRSALGRKASYGIEALRVDDFIADRWVVEGDGREIVSTMLRSLLLRKYIDEYDDAHPGAAFQVNEQFIRELGGFTEEIYGVETNPGLLAALTEKERAVFDIIDRYREQLKANGWVDHIEALDGTGSSGPYALVLDTIEPDCARHRMLMERAGIPEVTGGSGKGFASALAETVDTCVIPSIVVCSGDEAPEGQDVELTELTSAFAAGVAGEGPQEKDAGAVPDGGGEAAAAGKMTGVPAAPIEARGGVRLGVAHGAHTEPALISSLIASAIDDGYGPSDICVVFDGMEDELRSLARFCRTAEIPLTADVVHPLCDTWVYEQMFALEKMMTSAEGSADLLDSATMFLLNPLNGLSQEDSWRMDRQRRIGRQVDGARIIADMVRRSEDCASLVEAARVIFLREAAPADRRSALARHAELTRAAAIRRLGSDDEVIAREMDALSSMRNLFLQAWDHGVEGDMDIFGAQEISSPVATTERPRAQSVCVRRSTSIGLSRYPVVILAGLTASRYPMACESTPFDILAERLGVPVKPDRAGQLARWYLRICQATGRRLVLEYATGDPESPDRPCALLEDTLALYGMQRTSEREEGIPQALDPFLTVMDEMDGAALMAPLTADRRDFVSALRNSGKHYTTEQRGAFRELEGLLDPQHEYSATEIERYLECPYQWFYARKLNPKSIDTGFGPIERGRIYHGALERFYRWFTGQSALPDSIAEGFRTDADNRLTPQRHIGGENLEMAQNLLVCAVDDYIADNREKVYVVDAAERHAVLGYKAELRGFLETEPPFLPGYEPHCFELQFGSGSGKAVRYAGVSVSGKIDRMDVQQETGRVVIIDYKTGDIARYHLQDPSKSPSDLDSPPPIQAELYASVVAALYGYRPVGSIYRHIRDGRTAGPWDRGIFPGGEEIGLYAKDGIGTGDLDADDADSAYQAYLSRTEEYVKERLEALMAGHIEPDPSAPLRKHSPCGYCPARDFCGMV